MSVRLNYHVPAGTQLMTGGRSFFLYPQKGGVYRAEDVLTGRSEMWTADQFLDRSSRADASRSYHNVRGSLASARIQAGGLFHRDQLNAKGRDTVKLRKALMVGIEALEAEGLKITGPALAKLQNRRKIRDFAQSHYPDRPIWITPRGGSTRECAIMPKGRTLRDYWTRYVDAVFDEMALADQNWLKGNRTPRIHWRVRELIDQAIDEVHLDLKKPQISVALSRLETLITLENERRAVREQSELNCVTHKTVSDHVTMINATALAIARDGERAATNARTRGSTDTRALMIGEDVEVDECKLSVLTPVRKTGFWTGLSAEDKEALEELEEYVTSRLWLVLVLDVATRMPLGWTLADAPNHEATLDALRMATRSKEREKIMCGCDCDPMPAVGLACVANDNGSGLRNGSVKAALLGSGAQVVDVRAYHSGDTPFAERMWNTMESQLINLLHGYTGRKAGHLKGYDAKKNAVIFREELFRLITRYLIDEYPYQNHYGTMVFGRSPIHVATQLAEEGWAIAVPSPQDRRLHLGWRKEAMITDEGVKVFGLPYNSPELQKFRDSTKRKVAVFCDPDCVNEVTVIVEGHPAPICVDLSWTEMRDMTIPEVLAHYEELRRKDPANLKDTRVRLARLRQERFDYLKSKAIENGLARSYMTRADAEKKATVLTAGMQSSKPKITEGTVAPGTLADLECDPFAYDIGDGFEPPIEGDLTSGTQDERAVFGRPEHAGKLK